MSLLATLREVLQGIRPRSPYLTGGCRRFHYLCTSQVALGLLLVLGVLRASIFLMAYPPAHGADSTDFFLYAAQFKGLEAPIVFQLLYPLYPLLIYLTHHLLGSVYWLIGVQVLFSILQGPLFYWGIYRYSPVLGFLVALMVIGDAQTGILYNFTSTEPLYMFALTLAFCVVLRQIKSPSSRRLQGGDVVLGIALAVALLTRPVGRYLIVPFGLLFLIGTRHWWRTAIVGLSFAGVLAIMMVFNLLAFGRFELNGGGSFMLYRPLLKSGLLSAENGPASAQFLALYAGCPEGPQGEDVTLCMVNQVGDWSAVRQLYADAYRELWRTHGRAFARQVWDAFTDFLRMPGQQYRGALTPSDVQCADLEAKVQRDTTKLLEKDVLLYGTGITYEQLSPIVRDIATAMCPPWPDHDQVRRAVDYLALRYRSLSRPHPYAWYGALAVLVLGVPWARKYLLMVVLAGGLLAYHAAVSAVVLNVQPRYVAVANPYKGVLLLVLVYILGAILLRIIERWLRPGEARGTPDRAGG